MWAACLIRDETFARASRTAMLLMNCRGGLVDACPGNDVNWRAGEAKGAGFMTFFFDAAFGVHQNARDRPGCTAKMWGRAGDRSDRVREEAGTRHVLAGQPYSTGCWRWLYSSSGADSCALLPDLLPCGRSDLCVSAVKVSGFLSPESLKPETWMRPAVSARYLASADC